MLPALPFLALLGAAPPGPVQDKVGDETCLICHDTLVSARHTPHAKVECESCHGAGSAHVEAGGDLNLGFKARDQSWVVSRCLPCHEGGEDLSTFLSSSHGKSRLSCASCHQMHPVRARADLLAGRQQEFCLACHTESAGEFRKPYHHPVLEGAMDCSDCHAPHGGDRRASRRLTAATENGCASCHSDKAGPFVFEHAPLEIDGCEGCHQPHGSTNPKLLLRNQMHLLCLECHSSTAGVAGGSPFAFHDLRTPRFRNCTTCHRTIHGSNASSTFLR